MLQDTPTNSSVCPVCFAFATDDPAALQQHSEQCFRRLSTGSRDGGASPTLPFDEEEAYKQYLALRALRLVQTGSLLITLNSLGTATRLGLPLLASRWERVHSRGLAQSAMPVLYSPVAGDAPLLPSHLPDGVLRQFARRLLLPVALLRLPASIAVFVLTTSPAWRHWYLRHHERVWSAMLVLETLVAGFYLEAVIWDLLHRVVVWPAAMIVTMTIGDLIAHVTGVRAPPSRCTRGKARYGMSHSEGARLGVMAPPQQGCDVDCFAPATL